MDKRLYKSNTNKYILGVCGGIGEYLNVDPTVIRILFVLFGFTVAGIFVYFIAGSIMPESPYN